MRRLLLSTAVLAVLATRLAAQTAAPAATPAGGAAPAAPAAPRPVPTAAQQIAAAVLPLPDSLRAGARVWGYGPDGAFTELRPGSGVMTCIADDPKDQRFHVACYHNSMEAFMARGRELRAHGANQTTVDSVREAESRSGRIRMPASAMLYSLNGPATSYDAATNQVHGARPLFVVYVPFATAESLGLSAIAKPGVPWMMHAGMANAHIMFVPEM